MHLLLHRFQLLRPRAQLVHTLLAGTFLATRWHAAKVRSLYYLSDGNRGFFAEVGFDSAQDSFVVLHSFGDSEALAAYVGEVRLP